MSLERAVEVALDWMDPDGPEPVVGMSERFDAAATLRAWQAFMEYRSDVVEDFAAYFESYRAAKGARP